jgi:hypothetical protein
MPFGALQTIAILLGCYCAAKLRIKSAVLAGFMILVCLHFFRSQADVTHVITLHIS